MVLQVDLDRAMVKIADKVMEETEEETEEDTRTKALIETRATVIDKIVTLHLELMDIDS